MCFLAGTLRGLLSVTYSCLFNPHKFVRDGSYYSYFREEENEILRGQVASQGHPANHLTWWSWDSDQALADLEIIPTVLESHFLSALASCHEVTETVPLIK